MPDREDRKKKILWIRSGFPGDIFHLPGEGKLLEIDSIRLSGEHLVGIIDQSGPILSILFMLSLTEMDCIVLWNPKQIENRLRSEVSRLGAGRIGPQITIRISRKQRSWRHQ
ncbi:MAG: hypothetical protein UZ16_OP3001003579, partial [Candidatus Hinthialibacteria bacterium OLB16]